METTRAHRGLLIVATMLMACAVGTEGDVMDGGGSTPAEDTGDQDAALEDAPPPGDDVAVADVAKLDDVATSDVPPDSALPESDATVPDVTTGLDVAVMDVPVAPDVTAMDVVTVRDVIIVRDAADVPDGPDAPADGGGCPSGSSLCGGACVDHRASPATCGGGTNLGSFCGDTSCGFLCGGTDYRSVGTRSGQNSQWFRARAVECSNCPATLRARITLMVPPGIDYDLYVYRPCGTVIGRSLGLAGATDRVEVSEGDSLTSSDSFDYFIEVRYVSGASCGSWTLTLEARSNNGSSC